MWPSSVRCSLHCYARSSQQYRCARRVLSHRRICAQDIHVHHQACQKKSESGEYLFFLRLPVLLPLIPPPLGSVMVEPMAPMRSSLVMASTEEMLKVRLRFTPADRLERNLLFSFCAEWNRDDNLGFEGEAADEVDAFTLALARLIRSSRPNGRILELD